jgi:PAT family beta-lactamase induction signal transducer AmpG
MVLSLMAALPVHFSTQLHLFTILILIHNAFAATQDVAIDALAVNVLKEDERGLANGLMFAGAYLGQTIGGSGVLLLTPHIGFQATTSSSQRGLRSQPSWRSRCGAQGSAAAS